MFFLLVLTAVSMCFTVSESSETKQRVASLVVLPPLVLGYDELYHESSETDKKPVPVLREQPAAPVNNKEPLAARRQNKGPTTTPVKNKEPSAVSINDKEPPGSPVKNKKPLASQLTDKKTLAAPVNNKKPENTRKPQRTIIIDTKGRRNFRRNYRSILKKLKKDQLAV